jgi:hypothetical protein
MAAKRRRATVNAPVSGGLVATLLVCALFGGMVLVAAHPVAKLQHGAEAMVSATAAAMGKTAATTQLAFAMPVRADK